MTIRPNSVKIYRIGRLNSAESGRIRRTGQQPGSRYNRLRSVENARSVKHNEARHGRNLYESEYRSADRRGRPEGVPETTGHPGALDYEGSRQTGPGCRPDHDHGRGRESRNDSRHGLDL